MTQDSKGRQRRDLLRLGLGLAIGGSIGMSACATKPRRDQATNHSSLPDAPTRRQSYYDVVVIGSGYGASVLAARLAPHAKSLAVFERGREWLPGDFPDGAIDLTHTFRSRLHPLALLELNAAEDLDIFCGNGLGGTSLLNAAISVRPENNVFLQPEWPAAIRNAAEGGGLNPYFQRAEAILRPQAAAHIGNFPKSRLHRGTALLKERSWAPLPLNINRENFPDGLNPYGVPQPICTDCGDCCSGCNVGAKNTLNTNYLPLAKRSGAAIFTRFEAERIERLANGNYRIALRNRNGLSPIMEYVEARHLVVGAGSMGSTELLLRSAAGSMAMSPSLGTRLSANGDVMGMAYNGQKPAAILGLGKRDGTPPGPALASYINYRDHPAPSAIEDQFLLLDGVVPSPFRGLVGKALASYALSFSKDLDAEQMQRVRRDLTATTLPEDGALNHSMLYFACGHDSSGGRYFLDDSGTITAHWPGMRDEKTFQRIDREMSSYAKLLGARYVPNPRMALFGGKLQVTHPLGGCPMGEDFDHGVVDHAGRVYAPDGGVYPNFYVVDAAIIPRSLAAPPLLTISMLAERIADMVIAELRKSV